MLRERIINNNYLADFKAPFKEHVDIDQYYHALQLESEKQIGAIQSQSPKGLFALTEYIRIVDSERFCGTLFPIPVEVTNTPAKSSDPRLKKLKS